MDSHIYLGFTLRDSRHCKVHTEEMKIRIKFTHFTFMRRKSQTQVLQNLKSAFFSLAKLFLSLGENQDIVHISEIEYAFAISESPV